MMHLFGPKSRKGPPFVPHDPEPACMGVCSPTERSFGHFGSARPVIVFIVMVRVSCAQLPKPTYARRITDVDDNIIAAANARAASPAAIPAEFTKADQRALAVLGFEAPDIEPNATAQLAAMIETIEEITADCRACIANAHLFHDTLASPDCRALAGANPGEMLLGAGGIVVRGATAGFWMHNGQVTVLGVKKSQPFRSVFSMRDLRKQAFGEAIRYALSSAHDRQPLDWKQETPKTARINVDRLYGVLLNQLAADPSQDDMAPVDAALDDDLNTAAALFALHALARQSLSEADPRCRVQNATSSREMGAWAGVLQKDPVAWAQGGKSEVNRIKGRSTECVQARTSRNYLRADDAWDELLAYKVEVEDFCDKNPRRMCA